MIKKKKFVNACWFTNLSHRKRQAKPILFQQYCAEKYPQYDNYNAIEVSRVADIPKDYDGAMGVPITFLDKYNPDYFKILGITDRNNASALKTKIYTFSDAPNHSDLNRRGVIKINGNLKSTYARLLIKYREA